MKNATVLLTPLLILAAGCAPKRQPFVPPTNPVNSADRKQIEDLIVSAQKISVANESASPDGDALTPRQSVGFSGSGANRQQLFEQRMRLTKTLEKWVAFNPNADTLYPGSLIQGKSLPDGVLSPIATVRNPLTITITDLVNSSPSATYSKTVTDPSLATVTNATQQILGQNLTASQPAKISFSQTSISSIQEGFLKLGASYQWLSGNVSGSFQQSSANYATSLMIRFVQSYYTVSAEAPASPAAFISSAAKFADFKNYAGPTNPPAYVASVTYGRELWMLIESSHQADEVKAVLNAAFSAGFASGSVSLDAGQKKTLDESNIQIMVLGGDGRPAVEVVSGDHVSKLHGYLLAGANYSKESPGVIISYTIRYLKDNDVARISSSTDYTIKTPQASPEAIPVTSMRVTWTTTGDDKDWNSQPVVDVFDRNGRRVGHIDCCSGDRTGDHWSNGRTETRNLSMLVPVTNTDLGQGRFGASRNAVGGDDWDFSATVELNFADGQRVTHTCSGRNSCSSSW